MWKLEREEDYFRIYDSSKDIAGYFDPDYGELFPPEKEQELIDQMHKNQDKITRGVIMIPMVKFQIFGAENELDIMDLQKLLNNVQERISIWDSFLSETNRQNHTIRVSHTDQDMLSISFPIKFKEPVPLDKKKILNEIEPILDSMQQRGLL